VTAANRQTNTTPGRSDWGFRQSQGAEPRILQIQNLRHWIGRGL
jgi:hypothetical protein